MAALVAELAAALAAAGRGAWWLAAEAAKGPPYVPDKPVQPYEF